MSQVSLYRPVLTKTLKLLWQNKSLWFFGFFAALLGAGELEILFSVNKDWSSSLGIISGFIQLILSTISDFVTALIQQSNGHVWASVWGTLVSSPITFIIFLASLLLGLAVMVFFVWLAVVSQIALIKNTYLIAKNKKITINEGIDFAVKKFWPVLVINISIKAFIVALMFILSQQIALQSLSPFVAVTLYLISFLVFILAIMTVSYIVKYQLFFMIIKEQGYSDALHSALMTFRDNWLVILELGVATYGIVFVVFFISQYVLNFFWGQIPFDLLVYYKATAGTWIILSLVSSLIGLLFAILITAATSAFQWVCWVLVFNQMVDGQAISKLNRISDKIADKVSNYLSRK
ncbi:MAG: hypothetical protein WCL61_03195 [bacterium]